MKIWQADVDRLMRQASSAEQRMGRVVSLLETAVISIQKADKAATDHAKGQRRAQWILFALQAVLALALAAWQLLF